MENGHHHGGWRGAPLLWTALFLAVCGLVIVPFVLGGEALEAHTAKALDEASRRPGAVGVFLFMLLALDVVLPTPSSIVGTALGARFGILGGSAIGFAGMSVSCLVGYGLGRFAGGRLRGGLIEPAHFARLQALHARHGAWMLAITRPIPVLAEAATIFAGLASMSLGRFALVTGAANLGISVGYATVGAVAADANSFLIAFAGALLLPGLLMLLTRKKRGDQPTATGDEADGS